MNIYILEMTNYTGKSGVSIPWDSRFYLGEEGEHLAQTCLQTPLVWGVSPWARHHALCPHGAEEGEKVGTRG